MTEFDCVRLEFKGDLTDKAFTLMGILKDPHTHCRYFININNIDDAVDAVVDDVDEGLWKCGNLVLQRMANIERGRKNAFSLWCHDGKPGESPLVLHKLTVKSFENMHVSDSCPASCLHRDERVTTLGTLPSGLKNVGMSCHVNVNLQMFAQMIDSRAPNTGVIPTLRKLIQNADGSCIEPIPEIIAMAEDPTDNETGVARDASLSMKRMLERMDGEEDGRYFSSMLKLRLKNQKECTNTSCGWKHSVTSDEMGISVSLAMAPAMGHGHTHTT
mmetsp:Transcript_7336/g.10240  ORF Transcript_7336/g.10240 Transcript_7336/m.10240 type:complete len:273 (+) Transcript_7336:506-1324(+)